MSGIISGYLGIFDLGRFGHRTVAIVSGKTSWDVLRCPRPSWDFWTWESQDVQDLFLIN